MGYRVESSTNVSKNYSIYTACLFIKLIPSIKLEIKWKENKRHILICKPCAGLNPVIRLGYKYIHIAK